MRARCWMIIITKQKVVFGTLHLFDYMKQIFRCPNSRCSNKMSHRIRQQNDELFFFVYKWIVEEFSLFWRDTSMQWKVACDFFKLFRKKNPDSKASASRYLAVKKYALIREFNSLKCELMREFIMNGLELKRASKS